MVSRIIKANSSSAKGHTKASPRLLACCVVCLALIFTLSGEVWSLTADAEQLANGSTKQVEEKEIPKLSEILHSDFNYKRGNRSDPFVPFISERSTTEQSGTEEEILSGMRLFEPGQLTLVAITTGGFKPFALVQDSTGKGYIVEEGLAIGRRGVIKSIMPNIVTIEESFQSSAGQERKRTMQMVLRKEGEK